MSEDKNGFGGGSGGGKDTQDSPGFHDGVYSVTANAVELVSRAPLPPAESEDCVITLLAGDITRLKGSVNLRGLAGVRVTSGPPVALDTVSDSTNGIELLAHELHSVTIKRGLIDGVDQKIEMTPSGITIDGGAMPITIQSLTQIKLSVAGGLSTITLGPDGITIQGLPMVKIN